MIFSCTCTQPGAPFSIDPSQSNTAHVQYAEISKVVNCDDTTLYEIINIDNITTRKYSRYNIAVGNIIVHTLLSADCDSHWLLWGTRTLQVRFLQILTTKRVTFLVNFDFCQN